MAKKTKEHGIAENVHRHHGRRRLAAPAPPWGKRLQAEPDPFSTIFHVAQVPGHALQRGRQPSCRRGGAAGADGRPGADVLPFPRRRSAGRPGRDDRRRRRGADQGQRPVEIPRLHQQRRGPRPGAEDPRASRRLPRRGGDRGERPGPGQPQLRHVGRPTATPTSTPMPSNERHSFLYLVEPRLCRPARLGLPVRPHPLGVHRRRRPR